MLILTPISEIRYFQECVGQRMENHLNCCVVNCKCLLCEKSGIQILGWLNLIQCKLL